MKNMWLAISVALVFCVGSSCSTMAQDTSARGSLGGLVYDATKSLVPGASVTITGPIGSLSQNTTEQGSFLFSTLIPGFYTVKVQKQGFKVSEVKGVEVLINKTTSIEVDLVTGELTQVVEVSAANLTVDTSSSSLNADFADTFYQNIPVQRNVSSLFYLSPGAVSGIGTGNANPSISGSSGLENLYVADGVSINDPAFGGLGVWSREYGALGSGINLSFVKEVQVKSGGFEAQYGHASGGIVQIVTKSGGTETHGQIGAYFHPRAWQTTPLSADDFNPVNKVGRHLNDATYEGDFELGGYVPGLKNHLYYFGTFNPSFAHDYEAPVVTSGLFSLLKGEADRRTNSYDYAGKLTFKLNDKHIVESSVFGDPNWTNHVPWRTLNTDNTTSVSKWNYGTRNWATRYNGTLSSTWLVDAGFTWNWNHFTETAQDIYQIVDTTQSAGLPGQRGSFNAQGLGFNEPYDSNSKGIFGDTSKTFHFLGSQHTVGWGYNWQNQSYDDITLNTGPRFAIPATNADGNSYGLPTNFPVAGQLTDASFQLELASDVLPAGSPDCTLCPFMTVPGFVNPQRVVLIQTRGRFDSRITKSRGKYHAAYIADSWQMGKHVTFNAGVRWEQQRLTGVLTRLLINDMWSPRFGLIVDPKGDRKSKIYANFGRYQFIVPLDAAIRSMSSEEDFIFNNWAPDSTTSGCTAGFSPCVTLNSNGTVNFVGDPAHNLSQASGGVPASPFVLVNGAGAFLPGLKSEYTDEFVVGAEHEFRGGIVASVRYIDRRLKRVIEDEGGISVEQFNALAANGGSLNYFIGNPNAQQDVFTNPNETPFGAVDQTPGPCAADPSGIAGAFNCAVETATQNPSQANSMALENNFGFPASCIDGNNVPTPFVAPNVGDTFGKVLGSVCMPSVNQQNTWTIPNPNFGQPGEPPFILNPNALFGGELQPDGKPDTYKDPKREYQAVEFEVNKSFSHNWALVANWRIARLRGNYEGAFRNDNGQADPGISSLFDLTEGIFGLLGKQQGIGPLNTDRRHVVNVYATYVLDRSRLKGLVLGTGVRIQSGIPWTTLAAQQAYQNAGEVPLFGRGDLGRSPMTGTVDAHIEYPWRITEKRQLKLGFDVFNIANTKRTIQVNQNVDLGFGVNNVDFQKPGSGTTYGFVHPDAGFVAPFTARASVRFVF